MARDEFPVSYHSWFPVIAATPNDFKLDAGWYGITVQATVWGTAILQRLMPDGTGATYQPVLAALNANGYATIQLPAGQYRMLLAGVTAFGGMIELITPGRR